MPVAVLALAGCSGQSTAELAKERASQGAPCEASELEPANTKIAEECTAQKDREAKEKEVHGEVEAIREVERLKNEGR